MRGTVINASVTVGDLLSNSGDGAADARAHWQTALDHLAVLQANGNEDETLVELNGQLNEKINEASASSGG